MCSWSGLKFCCCESLKTIVGDVTLDEALENIGFIEISTAFKIEIEQNGTDFEFSGWSLVADEYSHLALVRDI
jgi:hypothetical protein